MAVRRVRSPSSGVSSPRDRRNHGATSTRGASKVTSTTYFQPSLRCSSTARSGSRSAGGSKVCVADAHGADPIDAQHALGVDVCDQQSRYHSPCRTTTAHGSSSISRSRTAEPDGAPVPDPTRRCCSAARIRVAVVSGSGTATRWRRRALPRSTVSAAAPTRSGSTRMILPSALPTASSVSVVACGPSTSAITRPRASGAVNISGGSRRPAADAVAAVRAAGGLDRDLGLAQQRDVAPRCAVGDAESLGQSLGGDPRLVLDHLQRQQRPGQRAGLVPQQRHDTSSGR